MIYHRYVPQPPLSEFVECFWLYDGDSVSHAKEKLLPTGTLELVIHLGRHLTRIYDREDSQKFQTFDSPLIAGPHSQPFVIDTPDRQGPIIGVHFKPGGAFPFFNLPAAELQNTHVSLQTLWGTVAADLRDRLIEAQTARLKYRILEQYLLARAGHSLKRHPAVSFALREFQRPSDLPAVSDVTEQVGLSTRHFIQIFKNEVGLTPKLFCRIQRFQRVIHRIERLAQVDWTEVALEFGYFDQAHFIHDFKDFCGLNPTTYFAHRNRAHLNHIPLRD